jgi:hypothetical protein
MIELKYDQLVISFPDVHRDATMRIDFQRTLRIPDDAKDYPLPPGLGRFPVRHVDDFVKRVPERWIERGGVMLPMFQSEAMWLNFSGHYPFAVKVAAGKINAVTGEQWSRGLNRDPQDYMVIPNQPWLDGYCVKQGIIRQFVAMPLGAGYSAEEQLTDEAEWGGVQIVAFPMKREAYESHFAKMQQARYSLSDTMAGVPLVASKSLDMGLGAGGRMKQEIYRDRYSLEDWDLRHGSRCFVHIANSLVWRDITGQAPPTTAPTAREYTRAGLPWFDYYAEDEEPLHGSNLLDKVKSVFQLGSEKDDVPLPENDSVVVEQTVELRRHMKKDQVREGAF